MKFFKAVGKGLGFPTKPRVTCVLCPAVSESWSRGQEPRRCRSLSRLPAVHRLCLANDKTGKLLGGTRVHRASAPRHGSVSGHGNDFQANLCRLSPSWACTLALILAAGVLGVCLAKSLKALANVSPQHSGCSRSLLPLLKLIL